MQRSLPAPVATSRFPAVVFAAAPAFSPLAIGAAPVVRIDGSSTVHPIAMKNAARLIVDANDLPLPAQAYSENLERITAKKVGSVYGDEDKARPRPADMKKLLEALLRGS